MKKDLETASVDTRPSPTNETGKPPWKIGDRSRYHTYVLSNGLEICELLAPDRDKRIVDATLIVKSVNAYPHAEKLAEALKLLINAYKTIPDREIGCNIAHRYDKAKQALAAWESEASK